MHDDSPLAIEPLTDFSREASRAAFKVALEGVRAQLGRDHPPIIDNKPVTVSDWIASPNPSHRSQVVGRAGKASPDQARQAIEAAARAFPMWRDTPAHARADLLRKSAAILRRRRFELAAWQVFECAKQWREADADLAEGIDFCDYYAEEILRLSRPRLRNVPGEDNAYFYEPRGVCVVIAPWNFPLAILCGMATAALAAGCTVVMKPAEQSSVTAAKLMEVFLEAGFPPGVVNYLPGVGEEVGPVLVGHPETAVIAFTGSLKVGLMLNRQGAEMAPGQKHVKKVIAEMGGKNAVIVDDDADLDEAVDGVVDSAFGYQGQKCSACSRVLVPESMYETFIKRLVEATRSRAMGPADDPGFAIGPVIDEDAQKRLLGSVERAKKEAKTLYAGDAGQLSQEGFYVAPHVFAVDDPRSFLAQDEFFGPVLAVLKYKDLDEALRIANGVDYALTGGIYSRSPANISRVKREFRVGNLYVNRKITGALVDRQPFGGFRLSGIGSKAGGPDYLLQFLLPRTITENTLRRGFAPPDAPTAGGKGI
ncbi:MAG: L-glutamate gamma-semialdehyde dehydrogenase [Gemmataceae bacterium]|nr:L-glutamate gamma-semialdehyde dehydrogenase [Gemmataceae bacterium]